MGLEDFKSESDSHYKQYGYHEYNEKLEKWADEMEERFPIDLNIEFVEVSPQMNQTRGMAYRRDNSTYYIRLAEWFVGIKSDERIKLTLLHEMVHVYFYRQGYSDTHHDKYFRWVVGRVGASMTNMAITDRKWQQCIEPFLEMEEGWD
jgi:predicted SprT family Zn-dependent metalloprotease